MLQQNGSVSQSFFSWTPSGRADALGDHFHRRLVRRLNLIPAQLFGSAQSASRCGRQSHVTAIRDQHDSELHNSLSRSGPCHVNHTRPCCRTTAAQPCRLLSQRRIWCERSLADDRRGGLISHLASSRQSLWRRGKPERQQQMASPKPAETPR